MDPKQKQYPVVDVTGEWEDRVKNQWYWRQNRKFLTNYRENNTYAEYQWPVELGQEILHLWY